ncbi:uncharacterized protein LOC110742963 isoform X2 [Papio anubis]|uniref:uncharacterized protein LOC110742963 isoform X2 n=1 Tax=Papio anubis TaxID=9555 RepID=UPI0004F1F20F|nr:uncharacterized protein LOC110742963 isoform X2 [Papio anubis]
MKLTVSGQVFLEVGFRDRGDQRPDLLCPNGIARFFDADRKGPGPGAYNLTQAMLLHEWCRMKKLNSAMILICNFLAATLLWWSSFISSWVEIELPGDPNALVSALFMDCSANFILGGISMISALLLSFCLKFLLLTFPQLFPETQKRYIFCASICIVTGALCLCNSWCCGALRVLTSQPSHMDTISSEKTKLIQAEE